MTQAGKSTLIKTCSGAIEPTAVSYTHLGDNVQEFSKLVLSIVNDSDKKALYKGYETISPLNSDGLEMAVNLISNKLHEEE